MTMDMESLAGEWDSYCREVLCRNGFTPETAEPLRKVFYSGAASMLALQAASASVSDLTDELRRFHACLGAGGHA